MYVCVYRDPYTSSSAEEDAIQGMLCMAGLLYPHPSEEGASSQESWWSCTSHPSPDYSKALHIINTLWFTEGLWAEEQKHNAVTCTTGIRTNDKSGLWVLSSWSLEKQGGAHASRSGEQES